MWTHRANEDKKNKVLCLHVYFNRPVPHVEWKRVDGKLPVDRIKKNDYTYELDIRHVRMEDAGRYECVGNNTEHLSEAVQVDLVVECEY